MNPRQIRHAAPVGRDVTVRLTDGSKIFVTVVQYDRTAMIAGSHPDLLAIPYERIHEVLR